MLHMMIDIETLSTEPNAVVLSIGAAKFTAEGGIIDKLHIPALEVDPQRLAGRDISDDTLRWWFRQVRDKGAVPPSMFDYDNVRMHPTNALNRLEVFSCDASFVWANAPSFDCTILRSLAKDMHGHIIWPFYNERCYRTWKAMAALCEGFAFAPNESAHNALSDAVAQAQTMVDNYSIAPF